MAGAGRRRKQVLDRLPPPADGEEESIMADRRRFHLFGVVPVAAVVAVTILFGMLPHTVEAGHTRGFLYTIEQGGGTLGGVVPLSGAQDVASFYGYPGGAARSDTGLEQPDTSLLFLYEDRNGRVSLVMIHDANDGSGGQVVFDFSGIPNGTTFVVQDDPGEASYVITQPGGTAAVRWQWNDVNTDGGALSGSLESQAWTLTITPQFPAGGGLTPGRITTWKFLTGALTNPTAIGLDLTEPIIIKAIPAGLQVVTNARLTAEGQNCRVATDNGSLTVNLRIIVEGMLQIAGQQIIAPSGTGGTQITFDGEVPANSTLTFTVVVDGGTPQVIPAVPVQGRFAAVATVTPPVVRFSVGPVIELAGAAFAFQIASTTVSTGPWTLTAADATLLHVVISPDFPQIGWTTEIEAEAEPSLTFANVSACDFIGAGRRDTTARSGFLDIKPGSFPNPINPSSQGVVPVAMLGSEHFDVRIINTATIEIDDDRTPGGGVAPKRVQGLEDVNGDGHVDLILKFATPALNAAGLLGNERLFILGAIGGGEAQVLGSDAICLPGHCAD
jgi:hypothetical protein